MNTIELLNNESRLIQYVVEKLKGVKGLDIAARNNGLEHFHYVGCHEAEHIICGLMDTDIPENLDWFVKYLKTGGRNNPLNKKISEAFWFSNPNKTDEVQKYRIFFWHGKTERFAEEVRGKLAGKLIEENDQFIFQGTLDDFAKLYGGHFMFRSKGGIWNLNTLCITEHSTFGQR